MKKLRALDWITLTVVFGMTPHFFRAPKAVLAVTLLAMLWFFAKERFAFPPPKNWLRTAITILSMGLIVWQHRTLLGLEPGINFALMGTALKFHELRTKRDYVLIIWLASLLMLGEIIFSQTILTTMYAFIGLGLISYSLLLIHAVNDYRDPAPRLWSGIWRIPLTSLPIVALLFVVFPRIQLNLFGSIMADARARIGFNDEIRPGDIAEIAQSQDIAFRASFPESKLPQMRDLYWRGAVLTATDGINWMRARRVILPEVKETPVGGILQEIVLEPHSNRWLFALDKPVRVVGAGQRFNPRRIRGEFFEDQTQVLRRIVYRAYSVLPVKEAVGLDEEERRRNLQLPRNLDERIESLGRSVRNEGANDRARVERALDFFRNGNFEYTFKPGAVGSRSIGDFLFTTKKGFCEHFASGLAMILRSAGIPARVVVGFQGGVYNNFGNYLMVRYMDAHAWVEAWLPGEGWTRVDPTAIVAPVRIGQGVQEFNRGLVSTALTNLLKREGPESEVRDLRWLLSESVFFVDSLNSKWNLFLLSYDMDYQKGLLERWGLGLATWKLFGLALAAAAVLIFGILFYLYRAQRAHADPVLESYQLYLRRLARRGVKKLSNEGPLDFSMRAGREIPEAKAQIEEAAQLYVDLRYGNLPQDQARILEFRRRAKRVA